MKKYFDKNFFKAALIIAIPIVLQQFVTSFAQLIDNLMVGSINGQAIAGVGAVNSVFFVLMTATFGISEGASIFIAQQYGAGKKEKVANSLAVSIVITLVIASIALVLINIYDEKLIKLFIRGTDSESLNAIRYGMEYLNVLVYGYWLLMINMVIASAFRALGHTKIAMASGMVAVISNTFLNFLLIPKFGVSGAAVATVFSRIIEFIVLFVILKFVQESFEFNLRSFTTIKLKQFSQLAVKMIPLTLNEALWGLGTSILMGLYGSRGVDDLASINITYTFARLLFVAMAGFGVAVAVLIGQELGKDNFKQAIENSKKFLALATVIGIIFLLLAQVISFVIPALYGNVDSTIQAQSANLLRLIGLIYPVYIIGDTFLCTLRAGGDTNGVLIMDAGMLWLLSIPAGFILVNFTTAPIYLIFLGVESLEIFKVIVGFYRYRKFNWVRNIA